MKTRLYTRKRALISSVAMLLVAMIALGTATFAWFTSSTTATAKGLNVKTIKASELVISDYTKSWGTTVNYEIANKVLMPASTSNGSNWYKADAAVKTAFDAKGLFAGADAPAFNTPTSSSYAYADQLNVMNKGEATVKSVTITWTIPNFDGANYLRVALVPASADGTIKTATTATATLGKTAAETFQKNVYDVDGVQYNAANGTKTIKVQDPEKPDDTSAKIDKTVNDTVAITPKTSTTVTVGDLAQNEAAYYNLYVWFEGQDEQCFDTNAGQIIEDIEFSVTGTTEEQV